MNLVTGSDGFMGTWLSKELKQVVPFDQAGGKDITDLKQVLASPKVDTIFHLAGISFIPDAEKDPYNTFRINTFGTLNLCELARKSDARLVFPSTYVYGQPKYFPIDEKHPVSPQNTYAESKYLAEGIIQRYHEEYGLSYAILRFFNVFGPGQSEKFLISKIVAQMKRGRIELYDPRPKRDYTYITDAVQAYVKAGKSKKSGVFNIGSGKSYQVREIAEMVMRAAGKKVPVVFTGTRRKGEILDTRCDNRKAARALGWKPKVPMEEGIKRMLI